MAFKRSKKNAAAEKPAARHLGPNLSFLDVVRDACARGGRFTCVADADETRYSVLVDSGGPFNVSGGGLVGSDALVAAARLTSGTYLITEGWPVAQPLYQIGLDTTLRNLIEGRVAGAAELPRARGVDALRSPARAPGTMPAETHLPAITTPAGVVGRSPVTAAAASPRYDMPFAPSPMPPQAAISVPQAVAPPPVVAAPVPASVATSTPAVAVPTFAPPAPQPERPAPVIGLPSLVAPTTAVPTPAMVAATPIVATTPPPAPVPAAAPAAPAPALPELGELRQPAESWQNAEAAVMASVTAPRESDLDPLLPGALTASAKQGAIKHGLTQSLLWLVAIDEPGRYILPQARAITFRAIRTWFLDLFTPHPPPGRRPLGPGP